jgi:dTDP-4-dehydrorhamnose reductase
VLGLAGENVPVEPATQSEFGAPFRKPQFSALANVNAKRLGITMRPWQEALAEHMKAAVIQRTRS